MQLRVEKEVKGFLQMSCLKPIFCQTIAGTSLVFLGLKDAKSSLTKRNFTFTSIRAQTILTLFVIFKTRGSVLSDRTKASHLGWKFFSLNNISKT